jgi:hypothetical protein
VIGDVRGTEDRRQTPCPELELVKLELELELVGLELGPNLERLCLLHLPW